MGEADVGDGAVGDDTPVARSGVTLEPDRRRAAAWTAVGLVATSLAGYSVGSSTWLLPTAMLAVVCAVPTAVFLLQLFAPETWTLHVDGHGVHGVMGTFRVEESFAPLRAVELGRIAGEPVLELLGPGSRRRRLLLPVGCDLGRLRAVLQEVEHAKARGL